MKTSLNSLSGLIRLVAAGALGLCLAGNRAEALEVIDPTGALYTGVKANSEFNGDYASAKLFDTDVTGVTDGTQISGGDWARVGTSPGFVAFELDKVYLAGSVFYAQRAGSDAFLDKVTKISIWGSESTPFTAADPGVAPTTVVSITQSGGAIWNEYSFSTNVSGRYFLIKVEQSPVIGGNIGGNELRLGLADLSVPPAVSQHPSDKTLYPGGTARLNVLATGTAPLIYQWKKGSKVMVNDNRISGATTPNLVISGVEAADAGSYTCSISNSVSTATSDSAKLTVLPLPASGVSSAILSNAPVAYWRLDEPTASTKAWDYFGSYDGVYGVYSTSADGPRPPLFLGFASTNAALQTYGFTADSAVALPGLSLDTNAVTIVAWINPDGAQQSYTGIVFNRASGTRSGIILSGDGTKLAYQWNGVRFDWDSGLVIPPGEWSMVAMVVTPTGTTLYAGSTNIVRSRTDAFTQPLQTFSGTTYIGLDTDVGEPDRTFNGRIDDVAIFNRSLSQTEVEAIYAGGVGKLNGAPVEILDEPKDQSLVIGEPLRLVVNVAGTLPISFQWYKSDVMIPGAQSNEYTVSQVTTNDVGGYYLVASNQVNVVTSLVAQVTVSGAVRVLSPDGKLYTGISANSEYSGDYAAAKLFDTDVSSVTLGMKLTGGDWAVNGGAIAMGPAYVAFQVDQAYGVGALYYAQRNGQSGGGVDKITRISVWVSETEAFDPFNPPTDPAAAIVPVSSQNAAEWNRYLLPSTLNGKYFLIEAEQDPTVAGSNIGGNELRLGVVVTAPPTLQWTRSGSNVTLQWSSGILMQAEEVTGPWVSATGVNSGMPIPATAARRYYRLQ
jgi:hypothetical protein